MIVVVFSYLAFWEFFDIIVIEEKQSRFWVAMCRESGRSETTDKQIHKVGVSTERRKN